MYRAQIYRSFSHRARALPALLLVTLSGAAGGCTDAPAPTLGESTEAEGDAEGDAEEDTGAPPETEAKILSAFHGLDALPMAANLLCGSPVAGDDGMPVVFSVRLDGETVTPQAFAVETAAGEKVTPSCATLNPANEVLERRTVLLTGSFGTPEASPRSVEVVGELADLAGNSLLGVVSDSIVPLEAGPSLVLAESYAPDTNGLAGECPAETQQVVQLTWDGGVSGPQGAVLGEPQRTGITVELEDGQTVTPLALADDDPDNHVHACLDAASPATRVTVQAGLFHDPGDDANPATSIEVVAG